jgi:hypothetical protein
MRRNAMFLAVFLEMLLGLCFPAVSRCNQASSPQASSRSENPIPASSALNCIADSSSQRQSEGQPGSSGSPETKDAPPIAADLQQDLKTLDQRLAELAQCIPAPGESGSSRDLPGACAAQLFFNFEMRHDGEPERDIPIGRIPGTSAFFYEAGMTIDADGAPNAYHPDNLGLDDLANAGMPGIWEGLAKDSGGAPIIQGPDDPFPGYYVSATALADRAKPVNDPTRYVDASKIPFLVLPGRLARQLGARPGDFAVVFNRRNGKSSYAIFGDVGPFDRIGEGSMALAENLGIRSDARNGGARRGIIYLVFPGSGNRRPRTVDEISTEGQKSLQAWEGSISLEVCTAR